MTDWRNSTGVTQDGVTTHHAAPGPWTRACGQPGDFTPQSQSEFRASHDLRHGQARMEISVRGEAETDLLVTAPWMISLLQPCHWIGIRGNEEVFTR